MALITKDYTNQGYRRIAFEDVEGDECSASESGLYLGFLLIRDGDGNPMFLSRETIAALLPYLRTFAKTGNLWTAEKPQE